MKIGHWMLALRSAAFGACVLAFSSAAVAQELVRQFSSELLLLESRQVLRSGVQPLRYADGEEGAALRRLLDPVRTTQVVDAFLESARRGESVPNLNQQLKGLLERYEAAFGRWPVDYEEEYLDNLHLLVRLLAGGIERPAGGTAPVGQDPSLQQLLKSVNGLLASVLDWMERSLREKIAGDVFTPVGRQRADTLARELARVREQVVPTRTRAAYGGDAAYNLQCAACHTTGAAGAPRLGDRAEWQRRMRSGFEALVQSTLRGKGPMPPQTGGDLQELEVRRAAAFLVNSGGFSIPEVGVLPGQPDVVTESAPPPRSPNPPVNPVALGERVYALNCQACHGQGQAQGAIPALAGGRSLVSRDAAVLMILNGSGARGMPPWRAHLSDTEVAAVATYVLGKFGPPGMERVTPAYVRRLR